MRENSYLQGGKPAKTLIKAESYQEVVKKKRVKEDNLRLYMNIIETRPTKQINYDTLAK